MRGGTPHLPDVKCCPDLPSFDLFSFSVMVKGISLERIRSPVSLIDNCPDLAAHAPSIAMSVQGRECDGLLWHTLAHTGLEQHKQGQKIWALWTLEARHLISSSTGNPESSEQIQKWYLSSSEYSFSFDWSVFTGKSILQIARKYKRSYIVPGLIGTWRK